MSISPIAMLALLAAGILATILTGYWFIAGPLGIAVVVAGLIAGRHATGSARTVYRISALLGAVAVILALIIALFLTSATTG